MYASGINKRKQETVAITAVSWFYFILKKIKLYSIINHKRKSAVISIMYLSSKRGTPKKQLFLFVFTFSKTKNSVN